MNRASCGCPYPEASDYIIHIPGCKSVVREELERGNQ